MDLSESFYIFLVTTTAGLLLACLKACYDSKCEDINLGCINIKRNTQAELQMEHDRLEHGISNQTQELPQQHRQSLDRQNI